MTFRRIETAEDAREYAIEWCHWASEENLSYEDVAEWQAYFETLAEKFDLTDEFRENGII